jgi:hypothetical protein
VLYPIEDARLVVIALKVGDESTSSRQARRGHLMPRHLGTLDDGGDVRPGTRAPKLEQLGSELHSS